jgi:guanylate kinase
MSQPSGKLIIISGPSGAGKSTVIKRVLSRFSKRLRLSISATTRAARPGEQDAVDYYFLSPEEFQRRREAGEFLEYCQVFGRGDWYGTLWSEVSPSLAAGVSVILEIDVEGTKRVLEAQDRAVTIFLAPNSAEELERRLNARGTESPAAIARRLEVARGELAQQRLYTHRVINDEVDEAVDEITRILIAQGVPVDD